MRDNKIKNKSTISPLLFIIEHLCFSFLFFIIYQNTLFFTIEGCSLSQSTMIFWICMISMSLIGFAIRWNRCMTTPTVLVDVISGLGLYTALSYRIFYKKYILFLAMFFVLCMTVYIFSIYKDTNNKDNTKRFYTKTKIRIANTMSFYFAVFSIALIIPISFYRITDKVNELYSYSPYIINISRKNDEYNLQNNIEIIGKIRDDSRWKPLSTEEKKEVLQAICNCEENYFGLDSHITVVIEDLEYGILGYYNNSKKIIAFDRNHLENDGATTVLYTCLHEMYHAWEYRLVSLYANLSIEDQKMYIFDHCNDYIKEIDNYKQANGESEEFSKYYSQIMEVDAREYARERIITYYEEIDCLEGQSKKIN